MKTPLKTLSRRRLLNAGGATGLTMLAVPNLAFGQARVVRMVSIWGRSFPLVSGSAQRLAERLTAVTDGALRVELFAARELVNPGEEHARVGAGEAEIYHGVEYFWAAKSPAFHLFAGIPFGLSDVEMSGWLAGPGQRHWDGLQAPFNIKPFAAGILSGSMGLWSRKRLETLDDFNGLTVRAGGLARQVLRSLGAKPLSVSLPNLKRFMSNGSLDAAQWFGPWADPDGVLTEASRYIYGPPVLSPSMAISAGLNLDFWFSLTDSQRLAVRAVFAAENQNLMLETRRWNALLLERFAGGSQREKLREFPKEMLTLMGNRAGEVVKETFGADESSQAILTDFLNYRSQSYREVFYGSSGFMKSRELPFSFGR